MRGSPCVWSQHASVFYVSAFCGVNSTSFEDVDFIF